MKKYIKIKWILVLCTDGRYKLCYSSKSQEYQVGEARHSGGGGGGSSIFRGIKYHKIPWNIKQHVLVQEKTQQSSAHARSTAAKGARIKGEDTPEHMKICEFSWAYMDLNSVVPDCRGFGALHHSKEGLGFYREDERKTRALFDWLFIKQFCIWESVGAACDWLVFSFIASNSSTLPLA